MTSEEGLCLSVICEQTGEGRPRGVKRINAADSEYPLFESRGWCVAKLASSVRRLHLHEHANESSHWQGVVHGSYLDPNDRDNRGNPRAVFIVEPDDIIAVPNDVDGGWVTKSWHVSDGAYILSE
jgi:hypothetical protein